MVHQCIRCELRFRDNASLKDHLEHDHSLASSALERYHYPESHFEEPLYRQIQEDRPDARRYLVLANQALPSAELRTELQALAEQGPATFYLVAPATPSTHLVRAWDGSTVAGEVPVDDHTGGDLVTDHAGLAQARFRLRHTLDVLHADGIAAHGAVADPNPIAAVGQALEHERCDEILVAVGPHPLSGWLDADLAERLRHRFSLPVRAVTIGHHEPA